MSPRSIDSIGLPADCDPRIRSFAEYWLSVGPEDNLPGRQHLDPTDIRQLLANVWLVDVQREPVRFKYRLVGTELVDYYGHDPTGKWIDEAFPHFHQTSTFRDFRLVVTEGAPSWRRGAAVLQHEKDFRTLERLFLPLAANGTDVDVLFCLTVFFNGQC